jgi:hypothetical protein
MFVLAGLLLGTTGSAAASEWLAPDHNRRLRLTYDNPTDLTAGNFPVLVQIDATRVDLARLDANRTELLFFDDDGTPLDHYVDDVDADGTTWVWVRLPSLPGGTTGPDGAFWLYYDSPTTPPAPTQNESFAAANAVWNNTWRAVVTLDSADRMAIDRYDTTFQGNPADVDGRIGRARYFDGNDYVQFEGAENDFDLDTLTVSAWVRRDGWSTDWAPVIAKGDDSWRLHRRSGSNTITLSIDRTNGDNINPPANGNVPNNTWTLIHASYESGGRHRVFIDGVQVTDQNDSGNIDNQGERVRIAHNEDSNRYWRGDIDHVTVQTVARGVDWVALDYASHTDALIVEWCSSVPGPAGTVHDADGDGVPCDVDCDDGDAGVGRYYEDADGDGFADGSVPIDTCVAGPDLSTVLGDCDDDDATVNPDAEEACNGVDDDCNGSVDEGLREPRWPDTDDDGLGDGQVAPSDVCPDEAGFVDNNDDCDDSSAAVGEPLTWYLDADSDGFGNAASTFDACEVPSGYVENAEDCDDTRASDNPDAAEVCDGFDNDCNGSIDLGATDAIPWYPDLDSDGQGADAPFVLRCTRPAFHVATPGDCDDTNPAVFTGALEQCNGIDNDCDGIPDDDVDFQLWFVDGDGDGVGDAQGTELTCAPGPGEVGVGGDCDDTDAAVNPNAEEVCDTIDNDCDGTVDEGASDASTWIVDADGDGFGAIGGTTLDACTEPSGYAAVAGDCDDTDAARAPGLDEVCDGLDNDCNNVIDDSDERIDTWFDFDMDGFGDSTLPPVFQCPTTGFVDNGLDCQDASADAYPPFDGQPGGTEVCDGLDNDCDGLLDDADPDLEGELFWADSDGDGFGDPGSDPVEACEPPSGTVANDADCNDGDQAVNPDAVEIDGNGLDDDCDGIASGEGADTADTGDTDQPDDTDDTDIPAPGTADTAGVSDTNGPEPARPTRQTGCGCASGSSGWVGWGMGVVLLVRLRRRSRRP